MRNTILSLTKKQLSGKTIGEFYDLIGILLHIEGKVKYDCRKILVSNNIKESIFNTYREKLQQQYESNLYQIDGQIAATWIIAGPKVSENLKDYEVEILPGFICVQ